MNSLINILIVDDSADDVEFTLDALKGTKLANAINVVNDGVEALRYLHKEGKYASAIKPSLVLLDLNMPRKDGREVLADMKEDPELRKIPVVILTTSQAEEDVVRSYDHHANCYISKPVDLQALSKIVKSIDDFWFGVVQLPPPC
jgi:two-component system, chemotaxis family, response regulator Rcp1